MKVVVEIDDDEMDMCNFCGIKDLNDFIKCYMYVGLICIILIILVYIY